MRPIHTFVLFGTLLFGGQALAQPSHRPPPPPHEVIREHADELGIEDATVDQIMDIAENARDKMETLHLTTRRESRALRKLLSEDTPNEKAVYAQVDRLKAAEAAQQKHQLSVLMDIRALLTPDQRKAIEDLHRRMRAPKRHHLREMGGHPPGHRGPPPGQRGPR